MLNCYNRYCKFLRNCAGWKGAPKYCNSVNLKYCNSDVQKIMFISNIDFFYHLKWNDLHTIIIIFFIFFYYIYNVYNITSVYNIMKLFVAEIIRKCVMTMT